MFQEFKKFAIKGNVLDMAVGVVIGGAFGKIVTSLVSDIIMPPIGFMTGGVDFSKLALTLKKATETTEAVNLNYGAFINNILDFVIISFSIFIIIKQINKFKKKIPVWTLYTPSVFFLVIRFFFPHLLVVGVKKEYWGYSTVGTDLYQAYMLFIVIYIAAMVYLALRKARHSEGIFKNQARNIGLGVLLSLVIGFVTQGMKPLFDFSVPESSVLSTLIFVSFIAYAINKYGMLTITTKIVAENIIATMNDLVVAVDKNMNIAMVNNAITHYGIKDLSNKPIKKILSGENTTLEYGKLLEQSPLLDQKMNLIDRDSKKIPVSVNISAIKEGGRKEALGLVFVMRDTREIDELVKNMREKGIELEKKNSELEQFNKLAVGREIKMIELKNRIRELEGNKKPDSIG